MKESYLTDTLISFIQTAALVSSAVNSFQPRSGARFGDSFALYTVPYLN